MSNGNAPQLAPDQPIRVKITGLDMPFGDMVILLVKWSLAAIPAALILGTLALICAGIIGILGALPSKPSL